MNPTMTHNWDLTAAESEGAWACLAALDSKLSHPHWLTHTTSEVQAVPRAPGEKYLTQRLPPRADST